MKVNEVRQKLKDKKKDELQHLIVEMYKQIPKKMRETKEIDQLIDNPDAFKTTKKEKAVERKDFASVESEVINFINNARAQNYFAPNRTIPKKERSKWRFTAKSLVEQVTEFANQPKHAKACASLLEEMYKVFCYASGHYVFSSQEPFQTLKIPQEDFLKRVVLMKKAVEDPDEWIAGSLKLVLEHDVDRDTLTSALLEVLLETLTNAPLKERMVQIAENFLLEKQTSLPRDKSMNRKHIRYEDEAYINNLVEMVFITQSVLGEYKAAVAFFKKHHVEFVKEVNLYILLMLIMHFQRVEDWIEVYEDAIQKNVEPRDSLKKAHDYIKRENEFPAYIF